MSNVPTNLIPTRITGLPEYVGTSTGGYMPYVIDGRTYKVLFSNIAVVGPVPPSRTISTANGLEGGGDLSEDRTISIIPHGVGYSQLDFTAVVPGTYGGPNTIPSFTVDETGRVTFAVDSPIVLTNYVPITRTITAGAGLTGGGQLDSNITISLGAPATSPQPLGDAFSGFGPQAARDDHVHPAVDLADTTQTRGVLPLGRGGTGGALSPVVGAVIYADASNLSQTTAGNLGQVLVSGGGVGAPYWVDAVSNATTATNLAGGDSGAIPYQSAANTTTFLSAGTGVLVNSGGNPSYTMTPSLTQVSVAGNPTSALEVATKQYVDTLVASGITYHASVKYEVPTINLNATYNNGVAGVGATLTNAGTLAAFTPDGTVASVGDRILIYNQTAPAENGVYTVTTVGSGSVAWVLTRATDANSYGLKNPSKLGEGDAFFVSAGATGAGETYVCNTVGTITFGTTAITFVQVSDTQIYSAGTGLTLSGTQFSLTAPVATSLGGTGLTTYTSGGAVYATSASALTTGTLPVTAGGTGQTSFTNGQLLIGNTTGNTLTKATLTAGTNVSITNGNGSITINATDQYVGTVTSLSVVSVNGFAGTVANASTTPAITLTTTITGLVKGDGTAISAASAGTDYIAPGAYTSSGLTMATARLLGRTTASAGAAEEISVGTGLSLSGGSLTNSAPMAYPGAGIAVSTGSAWTTSLTAPSGAIVGTTDTQTLTNKRVTLRVNAQTTTTSPWAWNSDSYDQQSFSALANALTINADAGTPTDGQKAMFRFKDDGTARALTWTTGTSKSFRAIGTTLPTTTVISKTVYVGCVYNAADSRWDVVAVAQEV